MEYRIAITTSTGEDVDIHFGQADCFWVYTVDLESGNYTLSEKRLQSENNFPEEASSPNSGCKSCNGARVEYISNLLSDCVYLLTAKIGGRPHRALLRKGISALETPFPLRHAIGILNNYYKKLQKRKGIEFPRDLQKKYTI
jgi:predicted Fe-Mo cluster-binding NifX family protein